MRDDVMQVAELAAERIRMYGWCQGRLHSDGGECCLVGAIGDASHAFSKAVWMETMSRCRRVLGIEYGVGGGPLMVWNDDPARAQEDVLSVLDRVASGEGMQ